MSKRAEEAALKAYPTEMIYGESTLDDKYDGNATTRYYYIKGYEQAENELIPLINQLCEAILFEWKDAADLARKTLIQIKAREE